ECAALQDDELVALEAIYPPEQLRIVRKSGERQTEVTFNVPVSLHKETDVYIQVDGKPGEDLPPLRLLHLPPLALTVSLPPLYPLQEPPRIVRLAAPWISDVSSSRAQWVRQRLLEQWQEVQGEVLWTYGEWAREGWVDETLRSRSNSPFSNGKTSKGLYFQHSNHNTAPSKTGTPLTRPLGDTLSAYDRLARQSAFGKERFLCSICLEAKRGEACTRIEACGHVFCRECLLDYLTLHLTEGSLRLALSCPDASCVSSKALLKAGSISVSELSDFLKETPSLLTRLRFLEEKEAAEADPTAVPCPRPDCQTLTPKDASNDNSSRWEAFRQCRTCSYSFCVWCRKTWHAPSPCSLPSTSSLLDKYAAATPEVRRALEARYGRKNLLRLKAQYEEEKANQEWLKGKTQACPHCSSRIEKSLGCNHMTCQHCQSHFCYLCGSRLNAAHPYQHFNTPGSPCFNRLFD
ncbi:hypothetical protein BCV69DRAFT_242327, partial [Microstroma glucosiphilum]